MPLFRTPSCQHCRQKYPFLASPCGQVLGVGSVGIGTHFGEGIIVGGVSGNRSRGDAGVEI